MKHFSSPTSTSAVIVALAMTGSAIPTFGASTSTQLETVPAGDPVPPQEIIQTQPLSLLAPASTATTDNETADKKPTNVDYETLYEESNQRLRALRTDKNNSREQIAEKTTELTTHFIPRFQECAQQASGTDEAYDPLRWLFSVGWRVDQEAATQALDELLRDHLEDPRMARVAFAIALRAQRDGFPRQRALDAQELIASRAPTAELKAEALFWRASVIAETESEQADKDRARADLELAIKTGDSKTQERAQSLLFEMNGLQIGMAAPEIEAEDLDGIAFKLSDYRGKVILLDFWGDW